MSEMSCFYRPSLAPPQAMSQMQQQQSTVLEALEGLVLPIRFFRDGAEARAGPTAGSCAPLRREL